MAEQKSSGRGKWLKHAPEAEAARKRVIGMIDEVRSDELVAAIKQRPSLRGMILGYVAELMFTRYVPEKYKVILSEHIEHHDDHDRSSNKADRTINYNGKRYGVQVKSIQTNSIAVCKKTGVLHAKVQNDASDKRAVKMPDGSVIQTTCYRRGDYHVLAVPLFPFTGTWEFAYKRNSECRSSRFRGYTSEQCEHLLATTEEITWPLGGGWTRDLLSLLD